MTLYKISSLLSMSIYFYDGVNDTQTLRKGGYKHKYCEQGLIEFLKGYRVQTISSIGGLGVLPQDNF